MNEEKVIIEEEHPLVAELHITDEDGNLLFSIDEQDGQFNIIACNEICYYAVFSDGRVMGRIKRNWFNATGVR